MKGKVSHNHIIHNTDVIEELHTDVCNKCNLIIYNPGFQFK